MYQKCNVLVEIERTGTVQIAEDKVQGSLTLCPGAGVKKVQPGSSQQCPVNEQEAMGTN